MNRISAVVITLNEERNIGRCLASLSGVVDDIVVIDSLSTDGTVAICESFGARVFQRPWEGYSNTKNWGNQQASHAYVLSIDADEALSPELQQSILEEKKRGLHGIYEFNRLTNYCGRWIRHCGWYPDCKPRIFPKMESRWLGDVHEGLHVDGNPPCTWLAGDLHHYSFYTVDDHRERLARYSALHAEQLRARGKRASLMRRFLGPAWKFFHTYVIKLGFLDGHYGFVIAKLSAIGVYEKYRQLRLLSAQSGT
jgi:(heptosyl)LPS beta-1,4-glucosyltransferase